MKRLLLLALALYIASPQPCSCNAGKSIQKRPLPAKKPAGGSWNSGLTDMMNSIESEVGPGKTGTTAPSSTPPLPPAKLEQSLPPEPDVNAMPPQTVPPQSAPATPLPPEPAVNDGDQESNHVLVGRENYLSDLEKTGLIRWDKSAWPLRVYIQPASNVKAFRPQFPDILWQSFKDWSEASSLLPTMERVADPQSARIVCVWTDNPADLMEKKEQGETRLMRDGSGLRRVDMKILTVPPNNLAVFSDKMMRKVALHEVGHALGLTGHSPNADDIMFATSVPEDKDCELSDRDKSTMVALYVMDANLLAKNQLDSNTPIQGDSSNPKVRAMQLNNQAAAAIKEMRLDVARAKLEEAHKLDPTNDLVTANLGALFANVGSMAAMARNYPLCIENYKKALPMLEKGDKRALIQVLGNYIQVLRTTNNTVELKNAEAKLAKLKGG